ncbi:MAG: hypothetical protein AAGA20_13720 [Planctomycetota bacterium]
MKEVEVDCPCCESRLVIDVLTQKVLRHVPKQALDEFGKPVTDGARWDDANRTVSERKGRGTDAFDAALDKEKSRTRDLDDLFDRARAKVDDRKKKHDE